MNRSSNRQKSWNSSEEEEPADIANARKQYHAQITTPLDETVTDDEIKYKPSSSSSVIPKKHIETISGRKVEPGISRYSNKSTKEEDISDSLKNIHIDVGTSSFSQPSEEPSTPANPTVYFNKTENSEHLLHRLEKKDTLQGLALKYGVEIADLKRVNKLWRNDDMFARKELIIPTSMETYLKRQPAVPTNNAKSLPASNRFGQKRAAEEKFVGITQCDLDVARHYLELKKYDFTKALEFYFAEKDGQGITSIGLQNGDARPVSLDDLDIWTDEEARRRQMRGFNDLTVHAINGPASLTKVSKSVQHRLNRDSEDLFNL
eukprot:TRINITY_DN6117_c0_g1_i1.p1 TRINITY_DN6117_c0_g1~~TRINITY_DN6117_c0_g1_i1.p1  ORF type:complete len:319 (+),score=70.01 TRINITY_DN6117_c0_g1_i1:106-1062(+)